MGTLTESQIDQKNEALRIASTFHTDQKWRIFYPDGDHSKLAVASFWDHETGDVSFASRYAWPVEYEEEAHTYAGLLALEYDKEFVSRKTKDLFLD